MHEEQSKAAPGPLALVQALVNTQYGQGRYAHVELSSPEQLRAWLVAHRLLADGTWARIKACRNDRCQKAFYDTSKNRSGAWCSMAGCGSRLKARAYRHRRTAHLEE